MHNCTHWVKGRQKIAPTVTKTTKWPVRGCYDGLYDKSKWFGAFWRCRCWREADGRPPTLREGGDASSPLFPSCTKFPLPSRSWLYMGSTITQLTTTSLQSAKNTNWWPVICAKGDSQMRAFFAFFQLNAEFDRAEFALSLNNKLEKLRRTALLYIRGLYILLLTKNHLWRIAGVYWRSRQVSTMAHWTNWEKENVVLKLRRIR